MEVVLWRCGKYGKFKTKGDEDKEYTRQINIINSKKIGIEYIQKINSQLVQYNSIIEKLKKKENQYNRIKLKTHLSKENLRKITREFFSTVDNDLYNQVDDIFTNGEGVEPYTQDIVLTFIDDSKQGIAHSVKQESQYNDSITDEMIESLKDEDPEMYSMAIRMFRPCILTHITLERLGNILDLHNLSHELTHSFIQRKQKESTLFDESPSFCIETLIDDFLLSLDDEKCKEYGFKKEDLKEDIILKNIVRFFSVGNQVDRLNTEPKNSQELAENQSLLEYVDIAILTVNFSSGVCKSNVRFFKSIFVAM